MQKQIIKKITAVLLMCCVLVCAFSGCGNIDFSPSDKLTVVCSIFAPYDFVRQVVGDKADVKMLLPAGVESHSYEPTPADIIQLNNADMFFYVSENAETWVGGILDSAENAKLKKYEIAEELGIKLHDHEHEEHDEDEAYEPDEHIWTNLDTAISMVNFIEEKLSEYDSENAEYYRSNAHKYINQITLLRDDFKNLFAESQRNEIVSGSRFAMKNFVLEFGLKYTAAFDSCVDNTEPSAGVMAGIIDKINEDNIPVIFYEELTEPKIARAVSVETGAKMLLLHSCHNVSVSEMKNGETYVSLMKQNYFNIKEALN